MTQQVAVSVERIGPESVDYMPALHLAMDLPLPLRPSNARGEVTQLLEQARNGVVSVDLLFGAYVHGRLTSAALAVEAPGSAALVFVAGVSRRRAEDPAAIAALRSLRAEAGRRCVSLLELLVDPELPVPESVLRAGGFRPLTTLLYLRRSVVADSPAHREPEGLSWIGHAEGGETLFAEAVGLTYEQSLDCPELTGVRSISDILAGHRAVGVFDPALWWVAVGDRGPAGVVLLNRISEGAALEIVYMGVAAAARGKGVGDALLARALKAGRACGATELALAVDVRNGPARRLYQRWGFGEIGLRDAWIATGPAR